MISYPQGTDPSIYDLDTPAPEPGEIGHHRNLNPTLAALKEWHAGEYVEGKWRSTYTPAGVWERAQLRCGFDLPRHWARNVVIAEFGSAVRNPDDLPKKGES